MKNRGKAILYTILLPVFLWSCSIGQNNSIEPKSSEPNLTIFFINDQHGWIENFAKIKYIVEHEKQKTDVIFACSGDVFSGNPMVDFHPEKGYPMIDLMNDVGIDIVVLGNHDFDYGEDVLKKRIEQSDFAWVCANVDMMETGIPEPLEYKTFTVDDLNITFLGLIETEGKPNAIIPSTHPWRVQNMLFEPHQEVVSNYADIKLKENADLYVALTHLGHEDDFELAKNHPYFDLIIGGHSHWIIDTVINNIPVFQAGDNLNYLGKIELLINQKKIQSINYELIDLNTFPITDAKLRSKIKYYNNLPGFDEVIGYSEIHHTRRYNVGCFYTDALREQINVDVTFQNTGGIRNDLYKGEITRGAIYWILPFDNGIVTYTMTVSEIKNFLIGSESGFYYSGIILEQKNGDVILKDNEGQVLDDNYNLTVGLNDYIPAVYDNLFPPDGDILPLKDAETIIDWLKNNPQPINYPECNRYFRYRQP